MSDHMHRPPPDPPEDVIERPEPPDADDRFYEVVSAYSLKIADAPPTGNWVVVYEVGYAMLMWTGRKSDVRQLLPALKQFAPVCALESMTRRRDPKPEFFGGPYSDGLCLWRIAPLSRSGLYWFDHERNLHWFDVGNSDRPPALPQEPWRLPEPEPMRRTRRKLRSVEVPEVVRKPRDYASWLAAREAQRNAKLARAPRRKLMT